MSITEIAVTLGVVAVLTPAAIAGAQVVQDQAEANTAAFANTQQLEQQQFNSICDNLGGGQCHEDLVQATGDGE